MPRRGKKGKGESSDDEGASAVAGQERLRARGAGEADEGPRCLKCQGRGHMSRDCPVKKQLRQEKSKCWVCGQHGHSRRECPGVDGESWCSKNKGKSAPPKGDVDGHRAGALFKGKKGKLKVGEEDEMLQNVLGLTSSDTVPWIDGYKRLDHVASSLGAGAESPWDGWGSSLFGGAVVQVELRTTALLDDALDSLVGISSGAAASCAQGHSAHVLEDKSVVGAFIGLAFSPQVFSGSAEACDAATAVPVLQGVLRQHLRHPKAFAVGVCGIDLSGVTEDLVPSVLASQIEWMRTHIQVAAQERKVLNRRF